MKPNKPFTSITDKIIFDRRLTPVDFKVYAVICQHAFGKKVDSYPSQDKIAFLCDVSLSTVIRSIARLIKYGYLSKERVNKKLNNIYILNPFPENETKSLITQIEKDYKIYLADVQSKRLSFKRSDTSPVTGHSQTDMSADFESDMSNAQSDMSNAECDTSNTPPSDTSPVTEEAIQCKQNNFESNQSMNLNSGEFGNGSEKDSEINTTVSMQNSGHKNTQSPENSVGSVSDSQTAIPSDDTPRRRTMPQVNLEMFKDIYLEIEGYDYYVDDLGKSLKQSGIIYDKLNKFYEIKMKQYYVKLSDNNPKAMFFWDFFTFALRNKNSWSYQQTPALGLLLKNIEKVINEFYGAWLKELNKIENEQINTENNSYEFQNDELNGAI